MHPAVLVFPGWDVDRESAAQHTATKVTKAQASHHSQPNAPHPMTLLQTLDYFGVFIFAVSGALLACRKDMDIFGMLVLALMPAIGGGTLRDLLLDLPVFWIADTNYLLLSAAAVVVTYAAQRFINQRARALAWADALGLSVFCVLGTSKAISAGADPIVATVMGVITAVAGGIIRDVVANEVPYVLQREIYATAALTGCIVYLGLDHFGVPQAEWIAMGLALLARGLGIIKGWSLPTSGRYPN